MSDEKTEEEGMAVAQRIFYSNLTEEIMMVVQPIFNSNLTERKRLNIIKISEDSDKKWKWYRFYEEDENTDELNAKEFILPVISSKAFIVYDSNGDMNIDDISKQALWVAKKENSLLSVCEENDRVVEAIPFSCYVWRDKENTIWGVLRESINSERTPTMEEVKKAVGSEHNG